jgi:hypothetical protein
LRTEEGRREAFSISKFWFRVQTGKRMTDLGVTEKEARLLSPFGKEKGEEILGNLGKGIFQAGAS